MAEHFCILSMPLGSEFPYALHDTIVQPLDTDFGANPTQARWLIRLDDTRHEIQLPAGFTLKSLVESAYQPEPALPIGTFAPGRQPTGFAIVRVPENFYFGPGGSHLFVTIARWKGMDYYLVVSYDNEPPYEPSHPLDVIKVWPLSVTGNPMTILDTFFDQLPESFYGLAIMRNQGDGPAFCGRLLSDRQYPVQGKPCDYSPAAVFRALLVFLSQYSQAEGTDTPLSRFDQR